MGDEKKHKIGGMGILLVLLTALVSGVATFVNYWAVQGTNSDAFIALRNGVVALLLVPLVLLARREVRTRLRRKDWGRLALIGLVGGALPFLLFFRGLQMAGSAGAATASFGYRTLFLMAAAAGVLYLKERVSRGMALGAALLLAGNFLLLSITSPIWTDGTALVLLATALWAAEYAVSKRSLADLPSGTVALGRMGFGGIFLLAYLAVSGQLGAVAGLTASQLPWVVVSAVLLSAFVTTWYAGLKHVDLSKASAVLLLAFPITWALEVVAGRKAFTPAQAAGAVAIVLGAGLAVGVTALRDTFATAIRFVYAKARSANRG